MHMYGHVPFDRVQGGGAYTVHFDQVKKKNNIVPKS